MMFFTSFLDPFFFFCDAYKTLTFASAGKSNFVTEATHGPAPPSINQDRRADFVSDPSEFDAVVCIITSFKIRGNVVKTPTRIFSSSPPPQNTLCLPLLHWFASLPWLEESAFFGKGVCVCVWYAYLSSYVIANLPSFHFFPPQEDPNHRAAVTSRTDSNGEGPIWVSIRPIQSVVFLRFRL